jgi:putative ATP-binding cassette transporter
MLLGSLREQACYPSQIEEFTFEDIKEALESVGLSQLAKDHNVDEVKDWSRVLSVGEQQRLAFARIIINKPSFVILDEGTSALDLENEQNVYNILDRLNIQYVSVGHRKELKKFHNVVLTILPGSKYRVEKI